MSGFNTKQKAVAIVELFQNALVYTTVLRNVDVSTPSHVGLHIL